MATALRGVSTGGQAWSSASSGDDERRSTYPIASSIACQKASAGHTSRDQTRKSSNPGVQRVERFDRQSQSAVAATLTGTASQWIHACQRWWRIHCGEHSIPYARLYICKWAWWYIASKWWCACNTNADDTHDKRAWERWPSIEWNFCIQKTVRRPYTRGH